MKLLVRSLALLCSLSTVAAFVAPGRHTSIQRNIINKDISSSIGSTELYSHKLVLVRHGESEWNDLNIFTGWADAALNEKGVAEAKQGGKYLKEAGFTFDVAYTSVLKRAIKTLWLVLEEMDLMYIPIVSSMMCGCTYYCLDDLCCIFLLGCDDLVSNLSFLVSTTITTIKQFRSTLGVSTNAIMEVFKASISKRQLISMARIKF